MGHTWYGIDIDLYPYIKEKFQQGQVWEMVSGNLSMKRFSHRVHKIEEGPSIQFETHAGTFYNVLLPQIRKSKLTQIMCVEVHTAYWDAEKGAYQFCEPYILQGRPDDTKMRIKIVLKHPKKG